MTLFPSTMKFPGTNWGLQSTRPEADTCTCPAGAYVATTSIPVSASRIPLFGTGEDNNRTGTPAELVAPGAAAVKEMPLSVSTIAPAALRTENVVEPLDRPTPAPGVVSKIA